MTQDEAFAYFGSFQNAERLARLTPLLPAARRTEILRLIAAWQSLSPAELRTQWHAAEAEARQTLVHQLSERLAVAVPAMPPRLQHFLWFAAPEDL